MTCKPKLLFAPWSSSAPGSFIGGKGAVAWPSCGAGIGRGEQERFFRHSVGQQLDLDRQLRKSSKSIGVNSASANGNRT